MNVQEGSLQDFTGTPKFDVKEIFSDERFPNVVVATDGTVVATWGKEVYKVRRSEDGGETWGAEINVEEPGFHGGGVTVDEQNNNILVFVEAEHPPNTPQKTMGPLKVFRSEDHGKTWEKIDITIHPDEKGNVPARHMSEHGSTLCYGDHPGRLIRPARVYNLVGETPPRYCCAIYSDDGGAAWHASAPFPEEGTGECALVELSDGRIYFSARKSYFDTNPEDFHSKRYAAWSYDGGQTWQDLKIEEVLPDGPRYREAEREGVCYNGHFGLFAGLTRLPISGRDVLIYSNADNPGYARRDGTVWVSFDGGNSWPVKRLVHNGPFAYSSLNAGRPGTASEGWIYLQYEGGQEGAYEGGHMARFNLSWLLDGERTGDGEVPVNFHKNGG